MTSTFTKKLTKIAALQNKVNVLTKELTAIVESHLGDDWQISYAQGDGWILVCPDVRIYKINTYVACQHMPRDEAITYIKNRPVN